MENMEINVEEQAEDSGAAEAYGPAEAYSPMKDYGPALDPEEDANLNIIIGELLDSSSESDDDDDSCEFVNEESSTEELHCILESFEAFKRKKRNSIENYIDDVVPTYTETEFKQHFRITKQMFNNLAIRINDADWYQKLRHDKRLPATTYLTVFLWFAGHEACSFRDLSDRFDLCVATISRITGKVTIFISSLSPEVIKWPNEDKKAESAKFFFNKSGFPKVIGCIDGTHVVIDPPSKSKDDYIDRKGNITLCMQGVCDENKKFINVFVGYPGSSHDSWVFKNSPLCQKMASACGDYYLLGDSAYGCTQYLLTPYKDNDHLTREQKNFNIKLSSALVAIEHTFGILKQRFRQLYYCKLRGNRKLCHFIRSCCVLHNLANEDDFEFAMTEVEVEDIVYAEQYGETSKGNAITNAICGELQSKTK